MATEGGRIDFMFLGPPPLTRPLDPLLNFKPQVENVDSQFCTHVINVLIIMMNQLKAICNLAHWKIHIHTPFTPVFHNF